MLENRELLVVVTTPEGKVYNHRSYSVSAEAIDGGITILPNHAPIAVSTFAPNVEPDTPDTNTLVKLSSFHV